MSLRTWLAWSIYPASWLLVISLFGAALHGHLGLQTAWATSIVALITVYAGLERIVPYDAHWSMTWQTFKLDLKYVIPNAIFLLTTNWALGLVSISLAANRIGPAHDWPLWLQLVACLLVFEAMNYGFHRAMHEAPGGIGEFLKSVHVAHHLPERVYVVMHAVFHPLNALFIQIISMTLPIWLAGYDQRVVTLFLMINGMHGLISHFNVDVRMGLANYIFVGTELHRYHHSADLAEARNYGATLSIYDQLFGTFVYKPGVPPRRLGIADPSAAPPQSEVCAVLSLPFRTLRSEAPAPTR